MKCPVCENMEQRSKVFAGCTMSTLACAQTYMDEEGNWHIHDKNQRVQSFSCSNGHWWRFHSANECPACDWKAREAHVEIVRGEDEQFEDQG